MLTKTLFKGHDRIRLRNLLGLFFLALAIPTAILIWQAYKQLKWEAFHQHRGLAEELTRRIDTRLTDLIGKADARSFADYRFLIVSGDPDASFLQRSPLSSFPIATDLPGVIGYFQVDTNGIFSTPLLPAEVSDYERLGVGPDEYRNRMLLADDIQAVLTENRLIRKRSTQADLDANEMRAEDLITLSAVSRAMTRPETGEIQEARDDAEPLADKEEDVGEVSPGTTPASAPAPAAEGSRMATQRRNTEETPSPDGIYSQQRFEQLNAPRKQEIRNDDFVAAVAAATDSIDTDSQFTATEQSTARLQKVTELSLDTQLQEKSENAEKKQALDPRKRAPINTPARGKRIEQDYRPGPGITEPSSTRDNDTESPLPISTFASEIDPLEFSVLDSGHFVLYRNVWREGERYIQGLLIDQATFINDVIAARFRKTTLSDMSDLIVAYDGNVIQSVSNTDAYSRFTSGSQAFDGTLLYRSSLSAPLGTLEIIFSIRQLPAGPGASVLGWTSLLIAGVLLGGFMLLYRLGLSQINLARQQQDFVSAVSHELKTPLTSIRMYGEMLKEGWVDENKRQQYYEFIHDESERLSRMISNVLQLAKITRNEPQFNSQLTQVGALMSNIESKIAQQIEHAGFSVDFNSSEQSRNAMIDIDEDCFTQIVINLIDNALKFSRNADNKTLEISARLTSDQRINIAVRDFGPGIPADQMKKIFTLFYRSESELTRETVGTGIGLAIVHQLTVAMHGKVDVLNKNPGAEFVISFPLVQT